MLAYAKSSTDVPLEQSTAKKTVSTRGVGYSWQILDVISDFRCTRG